MAEIRSTLEEQGIIQIETIQSPVQPKVARLTTNVSYLNYSDVPWIALIVVAALIIVVSLIMAIIICVSWRK